MEKLKWKMWTINFAPTEDIDQAYFIFIENEEIYNDFCDFYFNYYEAIRGITGVGMWVWGINADAYLNYIDCAHVINYMNKFKQNVDFWEEL